MRTVLKQCVDFFQQNKGFHRLLLLVREKYESLGRVGGSVYLDDLRDGEKEAFTGFFGKDYLKSTEARILLASFQKSLDRSRFQGVFLPELLEEYFGSPLITKKDKRLQKEIVKNDFILEIALQYEGTKAEEWLLNNYIEKDNAYMTILNGYNESEQQLNKELTAVCKAIVHLPFQYGKYKSLPVFATEITKDPHAFDMDTRTGRLLQYALSWLFTKAMPDITISDSAMPDKTMPSNAISDNAKPTMLDKTIHDKTISDTTMPDIVVPNKTMPDITIFDNTIPDSPEEKAELYYKAGLMIDDLSNQVLCCGFKAYQGGVEHLGWKGFSDKWHPISVPLASISQADKITTPGGKVLVVENPSIFNLLSESCREKRTALVCTLGQPNLAVYVLLDMAVKNGAVLFYSGDMDPEGLLIADRLKTRYEDKLELIGYSLDIYYKSISNVRISQSRIKKMSNIQDPVLRAVAQAIAQTGKAAYQEAFASCLL